MRKSAYIFSIVFAGVVCPLFIPIFLHAQTSTVLCTEGKYYCHAEGICKFAYQECKTLQCTPFGPSLGAISSTCASSYLDENTISTRCSFTGGTQGVNTPPGATSVQIKIKGGSGVSPGGFSYADTDEPHSAYTVVVGDAAGASGFGGGGYGGYGNGGGYSGIFYAGSPLMIAGGAGASHTGGVGGGGGLNGSDGVFAGGGSQGGGGYGGYDGIGGYPGGYLYGGYGGTDQMYTIGNNIGLAGGGGYFGGGGSINYWGSGGAGGGSGFCSGAFNFCSTCNVSQGACSNGGSTGVGGYGNLTGTSKGEVLFIWKRNKNFSADCALKNATTCNNNTICDANESCDCRDCNAKNNHCGVSNSGAQLSCAPDIVPPDDTNKPLLRNCSEILKSNPLAASGDYTIDPDGNGPLLPMKASCDMTTDGGGWTLIANAAVPAAKNGSTNWTDKPYFPLLGNYTVGSDNTTSTTTFGFINKTIGVALANNLKDVRVFAENTTGKKVDIKTSDPAVINKYLTRNDTSSNATSSIAKLPSNTVADTRDVAIFDNPGYGVNIVWIGSIRNSEACIGGGTGVSGLTLLSGKFSAGCTQSGGWWGAGTVSVPNCGCPSGGVSDSVRANIWVRHNASTTATLPQFGACCPAKTSWNSIFGRCVSSLCAEGEYFCEAKKICQQASEPCSPPTCNRDGTCDANESCDCADCTNGGIDDRDKCGSDVHGNQMICSKTFDPNAAGSGTNVVSDFSIQKLLAKADTSGVCPTDSAVYVPNLAGIVANDKICVRLVYNNATSGAISNALITDSLPTGFTRVNNSTKNCLTPFGSPDLCSDASGMGGAIGNNGWSGSNFSLTPHAGFYGIPVNKTTGDIMEMGKKRYVHYAICDYINLDATGLNRWRLDGAAASNTNNFFANLETYRTNTNKPAACSGPDPAGFTSFQADILGKKYLNHAVCDYGNIVPANYNPWRYDGTAASNTNNFFANLATYRTNTSKPAACSGPDPASFSAFQTDMLGKKYINHALCDYINIYVPGAERWRFDGAAASNTNNFFANLETYRTNTNKPAACSGPDPASFSNILVDLEDTENGKGYIQYVIQATDSIDENVVLPKVSLSGDGQVTSHDEAFIDTFECSVGVCCPTGTSWNCLQNECVSECLSTQAPSALQAGVDQPYITCTGDGDPTHTHFRYRITTLTGDSTTPVIPAAGIISQTLTDDDIIALLPPRTDWTYRQNYGIPNHAASINKICELAGFTQITNITGVEPYYWGGAYNEFSGLWTGTSWNFAYGRSNQIMKMTCNGTKHAIASSTSTNPSLTVTKLLAKADTSGVCPTDSTVYVPNLAGIVANDKICVRLVYNNATSGAVSNALITDSLPTGFTRITNSTKNCLTPAGSPELCTNAPGMGGTIGNNGWTGSNFSLTPHAGFYGIPTNKATGDIMEMGKKRYANYQTCNINESTGLGAISQPIYNTYFGNSATGLVGNCTAGAPTHTQGATIAHDLLGKRYANYQTCNINESTGLGAISQPIYNNYFGNTNSGLVGNCPTGAPTHTQGPTIAYDLLGKRYAYYQTCSINETTGLGAISQPIYNTYFGNSATGLVGNCTAGAPTHTQGATIAYDLLDTTNGKGYIQYIIQATTTPSNISLPNTTLSGVIAPKTSSDTSSSNATLNSGLGGIVAPPVTTVGSIFTSEPFPIGTQIIHPSMTVGTYKLECLYGTGSLDVNTPAHSCVKNITVKNDTNVPGCGGIISYKGNTLVTKLEDTSTFTARLQCIGRSSSPATVSKPFRIRYATNPWITLGFSDLIDPSLSASIGLNMFSLQNEYTFGLGNTDVTCAVRVGDGYSTNAACQKSACVGSNCGTSQTFSVIHSGNDACTTDDSSAYNIGCNPGASGTNRDDCVTWFQENTKGAPNGTPFTINFNMNGVNEPVTCTKYDPGTMPGGMNLFGNIVCTHELQNGEKYTIYAADINGTPINNLQTTSHTVQKDSTKPLISPMELYSDPEFTQPITDFNRWQKAPVTAVVRCTDKPGASDGIECACANQMVTDPASWSLGIPHSTLGPDKMYYTRTLSTSTNGITAQVSDTAQNKSEILSPLDVRIDTNPPVVNVTQAGTTLTFRISDVLSKLWKTSVAPTGSKNKYGLIYRTGPIGNAQTLMFGDDCGVTGQYAGINESTSPSLVSTQDVMIPNINTGTTVVAYCVQDNAGNVTKGTFPVSLNACFSSSNMPIVPNFDTYKTPLITRLNANTYGYSFSEDTSEASCFRGILADNIGTQIGQQLTPINATSLSNWETSLAQLKNSTSPNTKGYYYYLYSGGTNNTLAITSSPTGTGTKSVIVEGGNIRIDANIEYSGENQLLLLIARKNSAGQGGNIYINPSVTRIDALLIADGGALINSDTTALGKRLIINGRIYSYNTRGGSITASGTNLIDATQGKKFNTTNLVNSANFSEARAQDLDRFRIISLDGNSQCSLHLNYRVLSPGQLPALLQRPTTFRGSCGF